MNNSVQITSARDVADLFSHAIDRTVGAPLVRSNDVRLLRDATENYPAWLEAINAAQHYIHFESYIIHDDASGRMFADALIAKASEGVRVRLIYDWLGAVGKTSRRFWRRLAQGGVEVRCYNPPRLSSPFGWLRRDHRKLLAVDGRIAFVTGLCVGDAWAGNPARGTQPWRDTGVQIRGPAVVDVERAFGALWSITGAPLPKDEAALQRAERTPGDISVRIVASTPGVAGILRLDQLIAASARERLWLSDAYFAGIPSYVQALAGAARDGVDVRLLVPGSSDIALLRPISSIGYRPLLAAGVRVFEWNGPMMHAKTAVADSRWARVGSSNLNISSWLGNYELDVVVEDDGFASEMEHMYLDDLANATEIVLSVERRTLRSRLRRRGPAERRARTHEPRRGSAGPATAGALRFGNTVAAAITEKRVLASTEAQLIACGGAVLIALALIAVLWPRLITVPFAVFAFWIGGVLLAKAVAMQRRRRAERERERPTESQ